jgi:hypothetical protein
MVLKRSVQQRHRQMDAAEARAKNRIVKTKERARRDARIIEKLKAGSLPYSPAIMSWLSRKLDKPARKITPDEVKTLLD